MEGKRGLFGLWFLLYVGTISLWGIQQCWSLNDEGLVLLEFRLSITSDPYGALANWNPNDIDPCKWLGVHCVDGKVQRLDLNGLSLEGTLTRRLRKLNHLRSLLVFDNKIEGTDSQELKENRLLSKSLVVHCKNRKFAHCVWYRDFKQWNKAGSLVIPIKGALKKYLTSFALPLWFKLAKADTNSYEENYWDNLPSFDEPENDHSISNLVNSARHKLLDQSSNLAAAPFSGGPTIEISSLPTTLSSGAFPAVLDANKKQNQSPESQPSPSDSPHQTSQQNSANGAPGKSWKYIIIMLGVAVLVIIIVILLCIWRKRAAKVIKPWKTGISGQLQKAFVTGVPKLNQAELETACEDFSNIINSQDECTIYKGTLSSGVEIAVGSTTITSAKDWSKNMEMAYRKKIDTLSRVNHKNFTNLIGYCDEEEPFTRMMVFEYAPNGNLFEHLHVKEVEHLDWSARMRIAMGMSYCLQYMHHDLNPPVAHSSLNSLVILLTDDYAAKISEVSFGSSHVLSPASTTGDESKKPDLPPHADPETDVYNFGMLLLEIISGKLPYSEEQGYLVNWAAEYLNDKQSINKLVDPSLESFKDNELDVIYEVIKDCLQSDPRLRPTMKDITPRLREVLCISPEQAVPRLSPLWWAELEILSAEAT